MTIEEIAHKWAVNNEDGFPVDLKYIEFFYLKGLRKGLTLARQEIQKRMLALEEADKEASFGESISNGYTETELQKVIEDINALSSPSPAPPV